MKKDKISLVILVHNSAQTIENVVRGFHNKVMKKLPGSEFIVAEDGSTDRTKKILAKLKKEIPFRLITAKGKKGYLPAMRDAVKKAKNDLVFLSDGDGEHEPNDFWRLYNSRKKADIVVGYKTNRKPFYRVIISLGNVLLVGILYGLWLRGANCNFRIWKKEDLLKFIDKVGNLKATPSVEMLIRAKREGLKIIEVPIEHIFVESGELAPEKIPKLVFKEFINLIKFRMELMKK
ncbi:MAG: Glycosyltransferase AglD [Candidatus Woesearchaeota archaeon]|nr:Glycosyltransferase AglD [Candidatus Woesearchaeota archaeon]